MDPDPESPLGYGQDGPVQGVGRKKRSGIAVQACENCRYRRQKCDEERPKCATCTKQGTECVYGETKPTKKDKTLTEVLDTMKRVEDKIDGLVAQRNHPWATLGEPRPPVLSNSEALPEPEGNQASTRTSLPFATGSATTQYAGDYHYATSVAKLLDWPKFRQIFQHPTFDQDDLSYLHSGLHVSDTALAATAFQSDEMIADPSPTLSFWGAGSASRAAIDWATVQPLSTAYFDNFNLLYPIVDRDRFYSAAANVAIEDDFPDGITSIVVLLVLALGLLASTSIPVPGSSGSVQAGRVSGVRGGMIDWPPGLAFFNEARRRMSFSHTEINDLQTVQMFALAALYYGCCGHPIDSWRMTVSASIARQAFISRYNVLLTNIYPSIMSIRLMYNSKPEGLHGSLQEDLVRRIFWHCSIMKTYYHMEFGLPIAGTEPVDTMQLPTFSDSVSADDYHGEEASHFQTQFMSQAALHRLLVDFHSVISNVVAGSVDGSATNTVPSTIKGCSWQLDQWRDMLPKHMSWQDNSFAPHDMFTSDLDTPGMGLPYAEDIQTALLRTRYYYIRYLIHRPYIFKALHHSETFSRVDAEGAAECLKSSLKWPIAMSPTRLNKRLIPIPVFWSQNLFGILIILLVSQRCPVLSKVRASFCGQDFDRDATETVKLYVDWLRDISQMDSTARRCWSVIRVLYGLKD